MKFFAPLLAILAAGLIFAPGAQAQEEEEVQANLIVMRYFECDMGETGDAIAVLNGQWRSIMDDLEDEGMIQGYGILTHAWGDEWNLMDWFAVEDMHAFADAWSEALSRMNAADPEMESYATFVEACERHKDNIWQIVHAPEDEEEG
jgi:hypothetical protein